MIKRMAVDHLATLQTPESGFGTKKGEPCDAVSTAWAALAFKSAQLSGLSVPDGWSAGMLKWLDSVTDPETRQVAMKAPGKGAKPEYSPKALASAMVIRLFTGAKASDPEIAAAAAVLAKSAPSSAAGGESPDSEFWYFGTLAAFQAGGDCWKAWSAGLLEALLKSQCAEGCAAGSWEPPKADGGKGRLWSTALNVLSLEICYRLAKAKKG